MLLYEMYKAPGNPAVLSAPAHLWPLPTYCSATKDLPDSSLLDSGD